MTNNADLELWQSRKHVHVYSILEPTESDEAHTLQYDNAFIDGKDRIRAYCPACRFWTPWFRSEGAAYNFMWRISWFGFSSGYANRIVWQDDEARARVDEGQAAYERYLASPV